MRFSYSMVHDEETRALYQQMLANDADRIVAWRDNPKTPTRRFLSPERLVAAWWLQRGPTRFATTEDSLQYRRELTAKYGWDLVTVMNSELTPGLKEAIVAQNDRVVGVDLATGDDTTVETGMVFDPGGKVSDVLHHYVSYDRAGKRLG